MTIGLRDAQLVLRVLVVALLLLAPWLTYKSFLATPALQQEQHKELTSATQSTKPQATSAQANAALAQLIDQAIDQSNFVRARWGVFVISLNDGQVLYSRNGDKFFTPASNMKLYTTAAALDLLGSDYRWHTSVYAAAPPDSSGTIHGDLILYGRGAPDLVSETRKNNANSLSELANSLWQRGVRRVAGNVIGDESYFRGEPIGDGWLWNDLQWYFAAEASALSINNNEIDVSIVPPAKSNEPPAVRSSDTTGLVQLEPAIATVRSAEPFRLGIHRGLSDNGVRVWGEFPFGSRGYGAQLAVHQPALWASRLFVDALKRGGIAVDGQAKVRDSRVPASERFDASQSKELAFVTSASLIEIAKATNKESINLNAELILRTLGRERGAILPNSSVGRERGDEEAGIDLIRLWLSRVGISIQGLAIHDGSGLSRLNLVTPEATTRLLVAISRTNSSQVFRDTLPVSGKDGTLQGRLSKVQNRVSAKTGSLTYDNSLSGYITAENSETLAFSVMCNDQTGSGSSIPVIDKIATILADYPAFHSQKVQSSAKAGY